LFGTCARVAKATHDETLPINDDEIIVVDNDDYDGGEGPSERSELPLSLSSSAAAANVSAGAATAAVEVTDSSNLAWEAMKAASFQAPPRRHAAAAQPTSSTTYSSMGSASTVAAIPAKRFSKLIVGDHHTLAAAAKQV